MGMFDTFRIVGPEDEQFKNGAGEVLRNAALQSKDFDCNMNTYYIYGAQVFEDPRGEDFDEWFHLTVVDDEQFRVYCQDRLTKPVLALVPNDWNGHIAEHWAWCEWNVDFEDGKLVKLVQIKAPTREDLFSEVREDFEKCLLADDHPVAAKHFWELGFK
jgi:hypothetical protein